MCLCNIILVIQHYTSNSTSNSIQHYAPVADCSTMFTHWHKQTTALTTSFAELHTACPLSDHKVLWCKPCAWGCKSGVSERTCRTGSRADGLAGMKATQSAMTSADSMICAIANHVSTIRHAVS